MQWAWCFSSRFLHASYQSLLTSSKSFFILKLGSVIRSLKEETLQNAIYVWKMDAVSDGNVAVGSWARIRIRMNWILIKYSFKMYSFITYSNPGNFIQCIKKIDFFQFLFSVHVGMNKSYYSLTFRVNLLYFISRYYFTPIISFKCWLIEK